MRETIFKSLSYLKRAALSRETHKSGLSFKKNGGRGQISPYKSDLPWQYSYSSLFLKIVRFNKVLDLAIPCCSGPICSKHVCLTISLVEDSLSLTVAI